MSNILKIKAKLFQAKVGTVKVRKVGTVKVRKFFIFKIRQRFE